MRDDDVMLGDALRQRLFASVKCGKYDEQQSLKECRVKEAPLFGRFIAE